MPQANPLIIPKTPSTYKTERTARWPGAYVSSDNGIFVPSTVGAYLYRREYVGAKTPEFSKKKKRKQRLPNLPYKLDVHQTDSDRFHRFAISGDNFVTSEGDSLMLDWFRPAAYGDTVTSRARGKAQRKLAGEVNAMKVNLAQAFAERRQTAGLVVNNLSRIVSAAVALRHGNLKGVFHALGIEGAPSRKAYRRVEKTPISKRLANHWAEYALGWVPLLEDIKGSTELLASHARDDLYHQVATGRSSATNVRVFLRKDGYPFNGVLREKASVQYGIRYRLDSISRAVLAETGISNPALLAWELLPHSFVVDWLLPVGTYLKSLNDFSGFSLVDGYISTKWQGDLAKDFSYYRKGGGQYGDDEETQTGSATFNDVRFTRELISEFPSAALPSFRNPIGDTPIWKFATSMSLLRQVFGK